MTIETLMTGAGVLFFVGVAMVTGGSAQKSTPAPGNPVVIIDTSLGSITAELFRDKAPKSVENFLGYAKSGFYDGTVFHRVIRGFMIQGGGMKADLQRKPTKPAITNEATNGLKNARGTLATCLMRPGCLAVHTAAPAPKRTPRVHAIGMVFVNPATAVETTAPTSRPRATATVRANHGWRPWRDSNPRSSP